MKVFLYTDVTKNVHNRKAGIFAIIPTIFVCLSNSIMAADQAFEQELGFKPEKNVLIHCSIWTIEEFLGYFKIKANELANLNVKFQQEVKKYEYIIYGLQNPSKKKEPDYSI